ncbi:MAG: universal stress protein [Pseudomonadota bacterium]
MFRTLNMVLGCDEPLDRLHRAIALSQLLEAHLGVTIVARAPIPPTSSYAHAAADLWAGETRSGQQAAIGRAEEVEQTLAAAGVSGDVDPHCVVPMMVDDLVAQRARYADITLIDPDAPGWEAEQRAALDGALFHSGRPVLLRPDPKTPFAHAERVVLAWNATTEVNRAVAAAIGILQGAAEVHAVLVDPVPAEDGHGPEPGHGIASYLARHDIKVSVDPVPSGGRRVAEVLSARAREIGADLIVMGGYGHARLRERIFGGVTQEIIEGATVQTLMAH